MPHVHSDYFAKASLKKVDTHTTRVDYKNCVAKVQDYIADNSSSFYESIGNSMSFDERREMLMSHVKDYVSKYKPVVSEFLKPNNEMDNGRLIERLIDEIVNYDILTDAMRDPDVTEIRINNAIVPGGIWVEKGGKSMPLEHITTKKLIHFSTIADANKFINNILKYSKTNISTTDALVHGITLEGYRIAATDASAAARIKGCPQKSPACVIRKFSGKKLNLNDLIKGKSLSTDMAAFVRLLPKLEMTVASVGSTGCGKTVFLQAMLDEAPRDKRILLIQNPAEIDVSIKSPEGNELRDFASWEAKDIKGEQGKQPSAPTYPNLMNHSLRFSPQLFVFGELRTHNEFALSMEAANSGHYFYTTFHAEDAMGAINRYTNAVLAGGGNVSEQLTKETVCTQIRFIVVQRRLDDGSRKIISINEICGVEKKDGLLTPIVNTIFEYIPDPSGKRDENNKLQGQHYQVGTISESTRRRLLFAGASPEEIAIITKPASKEKPILGEYVPLK